MKFLYNRILHLLFLHCIYDQPGIVAQDLLAGSLKLLLINRYKDPLLQISKVIELGQGLAKLIRIISSVIILIFLCQYFCCFCKPSNPFDMLQAWVACASRNIILLQFKESSASRSAQVIQNFLVFLVQRIYQDFPGARPFYDHINQQIGKDIAGHTQIHHMQYI